MTDEQNNPNELPEEDWAMSESQVPVTREPEPEPIDEAAAKLYAPPDTGDLQDWDIEPSENARPLDVHPPIQRIEPVASSSPAAFMPPHASFEILKPLVIVANQGNDWGMSDEAPDGWQMPQPIYRSSEGVFSGLRAVEPEVEPISEEAAENLSGIYAPPQTGQLSDSEINAESSFESKFESILENIENNSPVQNEISTAPSETETTEPKKKRWSIIIWAIFIVLFLLAVVAAGVFIAFYYSSMH